jgi:cytochrome P450
MATNELLSGRARRPMRAMRRTSFDHDQLRDRHPLLAKLKARILDDLRWFYALARRFFPIASLPLLNVILVSRYDDVQEVLERTECFEVPYSDKLKLLNGGENFLLGMHDGPEYRTMREAVMTCFAPADIPTTIAQASRRLSRELVERGGGRIDVVGGYFTRVATLLCQEYFGVDFDDAEDVAYCTLAISTHVFVDVTKRIDAHERAAIQAAAQLRGIVDEAIAKAKNGLARPDTPLARLVAAQAKPGSELTDEKMRAILIGMISGFVPTVTVATEHILEMLFRRPDMMAQARAAAAADDDVRLRQCLIEALRFRHIHAGVTRHCIKNCKIAAGTSREYEVSAGKFVVASTASAMFDERRVANPDAFDPTRPRELYMLLGYGLHRCIGTAIAETCMTQCFKSLLLRDGLRPAAGRDGKVEMLGFFPEHRYVEYVP